MQEEGQVIKTARDRIAGGFCKHHLSVGHGEGETTKYCAVGALIDGDTFFMQAEAIVDRLYRYLPQEFQITPRNSFRGQYWGAVVDYNNHPDTTQADVVALYDKLLADEGII